MKSLLKTEPGWTTLANELEVGSDVADEIAGAMSTDPEPTADGIGAETNEVLAGSARGTYSVGAEPAKEAVDCKTGVAGPAKEVLDAKTGRAGPAKEELDE